MAEKAKYNEERFLSLSILEEQDDSEPDKPPFSVKHSSKFSSPFTTSNWHASSTSMHTSPTSMHTSPTSPQVPQVFTSNYTCIHVQAYNVMHIIIIIKLLLMDEKMYGELLFSMMGKIQSLENELMRRKTKRRSSVSPDPRNLQLAFISTSSI